MLIAVTSDLMAAAPLENAARQAGVACTVWSSGQLAQAAPLADVRLVVLDLNATDQVADTISCIRDRLGSTISIVAFGPHVHEEKLLAAKQANCTAVFTRGQFHKSAATIIAQALHTNS